MAYNHKGEKYTHTFSFISEIHSHWLYWLSTCIQNYYHFKLLNFVFSSFHLNNVFLTLRFLWYWHFDNKWYCTADVRAVYIHDKSFQYRKIVRVNNLISICLDLLNLKMKSLNKYIQKMVILDWTKLNVYQNICFKNTFSVWNSWSLDREM